MPLAALSLLLVTASAGTKKARLQSTDLNMRFLNAAAPASASSEMADVQMQADSKEADAQMQMQMQGQPLEGEPEYAADESALAAQGEYGEAGDMQQQQQQQQMAYAPPMQQSAMQAYPTAAYPAEGGGQLAAGLPEEAQPISLPNFVSHGQTCCEGHEFDEQLKLAVDGAD